MTRAHRAGVSRGHLIRGVDCIYLEMVKSHTIAYRQELQTIRTTQESKELREVGQEGKEARVTGPTLLSKNRRIKKRRI